MLKKCSKALKQRVVKCTDNIFEECVREVLGLVNESKDDLNVAMDFIRTAQIYSRTGMQLSSFDEIEIQEMSKANEMVNDLYQQKIKTLPTKMLTDIVKAHNQQDGIRRASKTIENILSEIARRSIFDDSDESDFISDDGDVHDKRKNKTNSKKTISKRHKAVKN